MLKFMCSDNLLGNILYVERNGEKVYLLNFLLM